MVSGIDGGNHCNRYSHAIDVSGYLHGGRRLGTAVQGRFYMNPY